MISATTAFRALLMDARLQFDNLIQIWDNRVGFDLEKAPSTNLLDLDPQKELEKHHTVSG